VIRTTHTKAYEIIERDVTKYLQISSLKNNNLRRLPKELGGCVALKTLSLNANDLISIPDEICKLQNVKRLTLAANNLQYLPWRMGDMAGLHMLDLASNPVIRLPASLGLLNDTLEKIELFECENLADPPSPIVEAGHGRVMVSTSLCMWIMSCFVWHTPLFLIFRLCLS
jgi:Leucine-rich repeat (LRR) protein